MPNPTVITLNSLSYGQDDREEFLCLFVNINKWTGLLEHNLWLNKYDTGVVTKILKDIAHDSHDVEHISVDAHRVDIKKDILEIHKLYLDAPNAVRGDLEDTYRLLAYLRPIVALFSRINVLWLSDACISHEELRMAVLESVKFNNPHCLYNKKDTNIQAVATDMDDEAHVVFTELFSGEGTEQPTHKVHWSLILNSTWSTPSVKVNYEG